MTKLGDTMTPGQLIGRAQVENAFIILRHQFHLLTAIYRIVDLIHAELWIIITEANEANLMRF